MQGLRPNPALAVLRLLSGTDAVSTRDEQKEVCQAALPTNWRPLSVSEPHSVLSVFLIKAFQIGKGL